MTPQIGEFFVSRSFSNVGGIKSNFQAEAVRRLTNSAVNHAGLHIGDGRVVEAMPGGARITPLSNYTNDNTYWSNGYGFDGLRGTDATEFRNKLVAAALAVVGTPYSWPDIIALGLAQPTLGSVIKAEKALHEQPWWVRRLVNPRRLTCGQLVDHVYQQVGLILFDDRRIPGLCSPGDLHRLILRNEAAG